MNQSEVIKQQDGGDESENINSHIDFYGRSILDAYCQNTDLKTDTDEEDEQFKENPLFFIKNKILKKIEEDTPILFEEIKNMKTLELKTFLYSINEKIEKKDITWLEEQTKQDVDTINEKIKTDKDNRQENIFIRIKDNLSGCVGILKRIDDSAEDLQTKTGIKVALKNDGSYELPFFGHNWKKINRHENGLILIESDEGDLSWITNLELKNGLVRKAQEDKETVTVRIEKIIELIKDGKIKEIIIHGDQEIDNPNKETDEDGLEKIPKANADLDTKLAMHILGQSPLLNSLPIRFVGKGELVKNALNIDTGGNFGIDYVDKDGETYAWMDHHQKEKKKATTSASYMALAFLWRGKKMLGENGEKLNDAVLEKLKKENVPAFELFVTQSDNYGHLNPTKSFKKNTDKEAYPNKYITAIWPETIGAWYKKASFGYLKWRFENGYGAYDPISKEELDALDAFKRPVNNLGFRKDSTGKDRLFSFKNEPDQETQNWPSETSEDIKALIASAKTRTSYSLNLFEEKNIKNKELGMKIENLPLFGDLFIDVKNIDGFGNVDLGKEIACMKGMSSITYFSNTKSIFVSTNPKFDTNDIVKKLENLIPGIRAVRGQMAIVQKNNGTEINGNLKLSEILLALEIIDENADMEKIDALAIPPDQERLDAINKKLKNLSQRDNNIANKNIKLQQEIDKILKENPDIEEHNKNIKDPNNTDSNKKSKRLVLLVKELEENEYMSKINKKTTEEYEGIKKELEEKNDPKEPVVEPKLETNEKLEKAIETINFFEGRKKAIMDRFINFTSSGKFTQEEKTKILEELQVLKEEQTEALNTIDEEIQKEKEGEEGDEEKETPKEISSEEVFEKINNEPLQFWIKLGEETDGKLKLFEVVLDEFKLPLTDKLIIDLRKISNPYEEAVDAIRENVRIKIEKFKQIGDIEKINTEIVLYKDNLHKSLSEKRLEMIQELRNFLKNKV